MFPLQFKYVAPQSAVKITSQNFVLVTRRSDGKNLIVAVAKKVAPKAVDRNRIKRLIKEAMREVNLEGTLKIIVKTNISDAKMAQVKVELMALLK